MDYIELFFRVFAVTLGGGFALIIMFGLIIWSARLGAEKAEPEKEKPKHVSNPIKWTVDDV